ncbi:Retrovirus-related Pol polyprotein from transposon 17.6, partial [Mucuna pruriens]
MDPAQMNYTTTEKELLAIVFALDKFHSYLLGSRIIIFSNHAALKFLLKKPDVKPRLIRWMHLHREFDLEIRDKKGVKNLVVDYMSQIERGIDPLPIRENIPDEQLLQMDKSEPWLADICNFLIASTFSPVASKSYKDKIESAFWIQRSSRSSIFVIRQPKAATMDQARQPRKYSTVGSIGPSFSEMLTNMSRLECQQVGMAISRRHTGLLEDTL